MTRISLSPIMDSSAVTRHVEGLRTAFAEGGPIEIDCQDVEQIGQAGLQLLASAVKTGQHRGIALSITSGTGLDAAIRLAGMGRVIFGAAAVSGNGDTL